MIGKNLKEIRENYQMNKKQFSNFLGIKYTTYNNYETNAREPASDFLKLVSSKCDVSIDFLLGVASEKDILHSYELKHSEYNLIEKYRSLDAFGQETVNFILERELSRQKVLADKDARIADLSAAAVDHPAVRIYTYLNKIACAGNGFYFDDIPTSTILAPAVEDADFIIGISGDSMEPTFYDGDRVYVHRCQVIETGDIGIFIVDGECKIKEAGEYGLISHNSKYPVIPGSERIICVGKVLGKVEM